MGPNQGQMALDTALEEIFPSTPMPPNGERNLVPRIYLGLLEIAGSQLQKELQAIRAHQNRFSLPNRLPTEVLEKIFLALAADVFWDWAEDNKLRWLRVVQVCKRWRDVAVNCAPLWTTVVLSNPEFMDLMLTRSKGMPLKFTFASEDLKYIRRPSKFHHRVEAMRRMLSNTERFRSISLRIHKGGPTTSLQELLGRASGPAPHLIELSLSSTARMGSVPPNFLSNGAPALRLLKLERVSMPWERIPLPSTLTSLTLRRSQERPTAIEFYTALSKLKALRTLTMVKWLPKSIDASARPLRSSPLVMESLDSVEMEDYTDELIQFFNVVRMPKMTSTYVTISDRDPQGPDVDRCFESVRTAVNDAVKEFQDVSGVHINYFDTEEVEGDPTRNPMIQLSYNRFPTKRGSYVTQGISLQFKYMPQCLPEIFASVHKSFDFTTAKLLDVTICTDVPPNLILEMFSPLQKLEELAITSTPVYAFFQAMNADPALQAEEGADSDDTPAPKPYFPALRSVILTRVDFEEKGAVAGEVVMQAVADALNARPEAHVVQNMELEACGGFTEEDYEALHTLVGPRTEVFWDDSELHSEEEEEGTLDYESA